MTLEALKKHLHTLVKEYFAGADVAWAGQKAAKRQLPFVTLKIISVSRSVMPIGEDEEGSPVNHFPSRAMLEVQLFTKGVALQVDGAAFCNADNSAVNDMTEFVNYMSSFYVNDRTFNLNISVLPEGFVQDVSALLNNAQNEYRAMQEFAVDFIGEAREAAGIAAKPGTAWKPTSSGGGTKQLSEETAGWGNAIALNSDREE